MIVNKWIVYHFGLIASFLLVYFSGVLANSLVSSVPYVSSLSELWLIMSRMGFISAGALIIFLCLYDVGKINPKSKIDKILTKSVVGSSLICGFGIVLFMLGEVL